jgi:RNA polymerase sigma factor (sigma-70 family)
VSARADQPAGREPDPVTAELVGRARDGDAGAFEEIYRTHVGRIYAICLRMVADPVQAEALTQDTFVRAWSKLATYRGEGAFAGWLRRLAVNVVLEERRARKRREDIARPLADLLDDDALESPAVGMTAAAEGDVTMRGTELAIDLDRAIAALPFGARVAFVLHDVMGFPQQEIAELLDCALGTVKAQVHRARQLLRERLGNAWEGSR